MLDNLENTSEWQRYRISQASSWLERVRKLVGYRDSLEASAAAQLEAADNLRGMDYSAVHVQTSPTADAIPNAIIRHEEAADAFRAIADDAAARMVQAARALAQMTDPNEARALHLYYVDALDGWERVCVEMGYSYDGMMKLRRRALLHAFDVMPHIERDALPPAL